MTTRASYLERIFAYKKKELPAIEQRVPLAVHRKKVETEQIKPNSFFRSLETEQGVAVIAEIKRRSPSKGLLRRHFDPVDMAIELEWAGARAISVLTDKKFFGGSMEIMKKVREVTTLPVLRKDFIFDEYQIYEARAYGADAVLLIAAMLSGAELLGLGQLAGSIGMDVLYEVHDEEDLAKVFPLKPRIVGINNRNLRTFEVDLRSTEKMIKIIPQGIYVVSESGIKTHEDILAMKRLGVRAVLVGEALARSAHVGKALKRLIGFSSAGAGGA